MEDAHKVEIFEAMMDAVARGDEDSLAVFQEEWERIDPLEGDGVHFRLRSTEMVPFQAVGYCFHCGETWELAGTGLMDDNPPGVFQRVHIAARCPKRDECRCWVPETETDERPLGQHLCYKCERLAVICDCHDGPHLGPCAMQELAEEAAADGP